MHLWPSLRIRDSFKESYLQKIEFNLQRMRLSNKSKKQQSSSSSCTDGGAIDGNDGSDRPLLSFPDGGSRSKWVDALRLLASCGDTLLLFILTCCCCCCFGAHEDEELR